MPTPREAPYKQAQREAELSLRESRRLLRIDRAKLMQLATVDLGLLRNEDAPLRARRLAASRWAQVRPLLSRRERHELGVR